MQKVLHALFIHGSLRAASLKIITNSSSVKHNWGKNIQTKFEALEKFHLKDLTYFLKRWSESDEPEPGDW